MIKFTDLIEDDQEILEEAFEASPDKITDSITNKRVITIYYMGDKENKPGWRKIEPYAYGTGTNKSGTVEYVRAWQLGGPSVSAGKQGKQFRPMPGWRFFRVDRIKNWNVSSNQTFDKPRPNFNVNGDKLMTKIIALADFTPGEAEPPTPIKPKPVKPTPSKPGEKEKPEDVPKEVPKAIVGTSPLKKALQSLWKLAPSNFADSLKKVVDKIKSKLPGGKSTQYSQSRDKDKPLNEVKEMSLINAINEVILEETLKKSKFHEPVESDNKTKILKESEMINAINDAIRIF
jgi:hypothetical protein